MRVALEERFMIRIKGDQAVVPPVRIEEATDPREIALFREHHLRFERNQDWLLQHWSEIVPKAAGKYLVVAGQEAFIADTSEAACALAKAAHPEDDGAFGEFLSTRQGPRIYATLR
jgi:hypothetical protein